MKIFGYSQIFSGRRKSIVIYPENIRDISGKFSNTVDWLKNYPNATEDIYKGLPEPQGCSIITMLCFDSDHSHDQVTR